VADAGVICFLIRPARVPTLPLDQVVQSDAPINAPRAYTDETTPAIQHIVSDRRHSSRGIQSRLFPRLRSLDVGASERVLNLFLVGDSYVGKTSLLRRLKHNTFNEEEKPTLGTDSATKRLKYRGRITRAKIWDVSGQIQDFTNPFFSQADGVFIVVDLSNLETVWRLNCWLKEVINRFGQEFPVVVVGNKCDAKLIHTDELGRNFNFIETSAAMNINPEKMVLKLFRLIITRHRENSDVVVSG
jgi:small GTP-binding protein